MSKSIPNSSFGRTLSIFLLCFAVAAAANAGSHAIQIDGSGFTPQNITVQVGDVVTWANTQGSHNVMADDGSFTSGPASSDAWEFSHFPTQGGTYAYHCEEHPSETGILTVEGVFGDTFESGDTAAWTETFPPDLENCDCYFSGDCAAPTGFCDWGVLTEEDTCLWRQNKPNGVPGAGCDVAYVGPWIADICDGRCSPSELGSLLGWEDPDMIRKGVVLWAEAVLRPAESGGGLVDQEISDQVMALEFLSPNGAMSLGRQVADLIAFSSDPGFAGLFCFHEGHPGEDDPNLYVDLSNDVCGRSAARSAIEALLAELHQPGSGPPHLAGLSETCGDWQQRFAPRCEGETAISCVEQRIANLARFLSTPRNAGAYLQKIFGTWAEDL